MKINKSSHFEPDSKSIDAINIYKNKVIDENKNTSSPSNETRCSFFLKYKKTIILVIIGFILVSVLIILLCVFLIKKKEKNENNKSIGNENKEDEIYMSNCSFKAIYYTKENNKNIELINEKYLNSLSEMIIDSNKLEPCKEYNFPKKGEHKIYFYTQINFTDLSEMFKDIKDMTLIFFSSNFNIEEVADMSYMFSGCSSLTSIDISNLDTHNIMNMASLFKDCLSLLSIDLSNFKTDNSVTMNSMFYGCSSLVSLDISSFETNNVLTFESMFYGCSSLTSLNFYSFNTQNSQNMCNMFQNCFNINYLNITTFNIKTTSKVENIFKGISLSAKIVVNKKSHNALNQKKEILNFNNIIIE